MKYQNVVLLGVRALQMSIDQKDWYKPKHGPRYQQLHRYLADQILSGDLQPNVQLPTERLFAQEAQIVELQSAGKTVEALVMNLIIRAKDVEGNPVFMKADKTELMTSVDPEIILRVINEMNDIDPETDLGN